MDKIKYKYHHVGIIIDSPQTDEEYNPTYKYYSSGYFQSKYGIELLRFKKDSPLHLLIKKVSHIAFEVSDLELAIQGKHIISDITSPADGVRVCFIEEGGAPVELLEFSMPEDQIWPNPNKISDLDYNHFGIATKILHSGEIHLPHLDIHCTDHEDNAFGLQWMRYEATATYPEIVKNLPHVAFRVKNLMESIKDKNVIIQPNSPLQGVLVAFIEENGIPIEFLQID